MFFPLFLFVIAIVLPIGARLLTLKGPMGLYVLASAILLGVLALVLRSRARRAALRGGLTRMPSENRVKALNWPETLSQSQLESYCLIYLRASGWDADMVQAGGTDGMFVDAERPDGHVLVQCFIKDTLINAPVIRALCAAAASFPGARPAILTLGRIAPAAVQAAEQAGVLVLKVADLARLPQLVPATPQPPPE